MVNPPNADRGRPGHSALALVLVAAGIATMTLVAAVDLFLMLNGG